MRIGCTWAKAARPSTGKLASAAEYLSSDRLDVFIVLPPMGAGADGRLLRPKCSARHAGCQRALGHSTRGARDRHTQRRQSRRGLGMAERRLGIIMNGVTGRMGTNQHLVRSVLAIRDAGGVVLRDGSKIVPDPVLVGRYPEKLSALAQAHGIERTATDLDRALASKADAIYFDAVTTDLR